MYIASLAGVKVFATGGIGGVHRGAEVSMDISADLDELGNTSVAVVCAGAKAILDLEKTLEYLETKGVSQSELNSNSSSWGNTQTNLWTITNPISKHYYGNI